MTPQERARLIDRYAAGADEVAKSLAGFPEAGLTAHPIPGKWSAREIVHHLADSEGASAFRIRILLCQERAEIQGYDQDAFAKRLNYNDRDHTAAFELFRAVRANTVPLLRAMSEADWAKHGHHSESGAYSAATWLEIYAVHAHDHADQIRRLRAALKAGAARS